MPEVNIPGVGVVTFPYDMPPDQIAVQAQRLYAEAQEKEAPLTRERQSPGAPSAMSAGHHPDTRGNDAVGELLGMTREDMPSDAAFLRRGPEVGGAAGMLLGGPAGAGVGAGLGSLAQGQQAQGAHMPTGSEVGSAALDGGFSALLAGAPRALASGARTIGPAVAKHAGALSRGVSALIGGGTWLASGNPLMGLGAGAAMKAMTSPGAIKTAGNLAGRVGAAIPAHVTNKVGFGALSADAYRQALLEALGQEPEQP